MARLQGLVPPTYWVRARCYLLSCVYSYKKDVLFVLVDYCMSLFHSMSEIIAICLIMRILLGKGLPYEQSAVH